MELHVDILVFTSLEAVKSPWIDFWKVLFIYNSMKSMHVQVLAWKMRNLMRPRNATRERPVTGRWDGSKSFWFMTSICPVKMLRPTQLRVLRSLHTRSASLNGLPVLVLIASWVADILAGVPLRARWKRRLFCLWRAVKTVVTSPFCPRFVGFAPQQRKQSERVS